MNQTLLPEAREVGIDVSQACGRGLASVVSETRRQRWLEDNQQAVEAWNDHVAKHDLRLAAYRQF